MVGIYSREGEAASTGKMETPPTTIRRAFEQGNLASLFLDSRDVSELKEPVLGHDVGRYGGSREPDHTAA